MKPIFLILLLVLFEFNSFAQQANNLSVIDTRNDNEGPNSYNQQVRYDFKYRSAIGVPGVGNFGATMTISQWIHDGSGDYNHQLHFNNGGIFYRNGLSNSGTWNGWKSLVLTNENGNVGIGTASPKTNFDLRGDMNISPNSNVVNGLIGRIGFSPVNYPVLNTVSIAGFYEGNAWYYGSALAFSTTPGPDITATGPLERMRINKDGNVGIGITNPQNKLDVNGTIHAKEVKVDMNGWSDFVFEPKYKMETLTEVNQFIKKHGHLPDIPSASEVSKDGVNLGEMQAKLLQKIEELTLYLIEKDKQLNDQQKSILEMIKEIEELKKK